MQVYLPCSCRLNGGVGDDLCTLDEGVRCLTVLASDDTRFSASS